MTQPARDSVAVKTATGSIVLLFLLLAVGVLSHMQSARQLEASHAIGRTHQVLAAVEKVASTLGEAESGLRGYVLCGNEKLLDPYRRGRSRLLQELSDLRALTFDNPRQQERISALRAEVLKGLEKSERTVALQSQGKFAAARDLVESGDGCVLTSHVQHLVTEMEQEENALLSARTTQFEKSSQAVHFVLVALIALAGLLVLLIAAFIASYLSERRRAEQALVHLATIVESSDDAILSIKPDGIIVSWNPAAERLYGYAAQEILGQSALRLVPPERKSELDEIVDKINKGGYRRSKC